MKKIMRLLLAVSVCLAITACSDIAARKQDSRTWTNVRCSGILEWNTCFDQARKLCPQGFDIANKEEIRSAQHRAMDVACKP